MTNSSYGSSAHCLKNFSHHIEKTSSSIHPPAPQPVLLTQAFVAEILWRHDYMADDHESMEVDRKRRIGNIQTLYQAEILPQLEKAREEREAAEEKEIRLYNANGRRVTHHWLKREYTAGTKILRDNIDIIFKSETPEYLMTLVKMMESALNKKMPKIQYNAITQTIVLYKERLAVEHSTSPKTETTV